MILSDTELCYGELAYELRLVAFFDILGWRNEILAAGNDPRHIARLAAAVRMFNANAEAVGDAGARLTTFSDNVVFSKPFAPGDVEWLLQGLATTQLGLAVSGFLIRGAVTVGLIHHDEHIVFGPALNRAYELESKVAIYPRILIDAPALAVPPGLDFIDAGVPPFLDPFKPCFWDRIQAQSPIQTRVLERFEVLSGMTIPVEPVLVSGDTALASIANRLSAELMTTDDPRAWRKLAWLFDRVVCGLGDRTIAGDLPKSSGLIAALEAEAST